VFVNPIGNARKKLVDLKGTEFFFASSPPFTLTKEKRSVSFRFVSSFRDIGIWRHSMWIDKTKKDFKVTINKFNIPPFITGSGEKGGFHREK